MLDLKVAKIDRLKKKTSLLNNLYQLKVVKIDKNNHFTMTNRVCLGFRLKKQDDYF